MIYTSNYNNFKDSKYKTISISRDRGEDALYNGDTYISLAPKKDFFKIWRHNKGVIPDMENNKYYIKEYYNQVLKDLDPISVYNDLDGFILLCYEDSSEFCHRHIVAAWFELLLNKKVFEVVHMDDKIKKTSRPTYIKEYLEELIKEEQKSENNIYYNFKRR